MTNTHTHLAGSSGTAEAPAVWENHWALRPALGRRGRSALEVYENGELLDVMVESSLDPGLLRGARQAVRPANGGAAVNLAWGRLGADGAPPAVSFLGRRGWRGRRKQPARATSVAGSFWFACAEGPFSAVEAETVDGRSALVRITRGG